MELAFDLLKALRRTFSASVRWIAMNILQIAISCFFALSMLAHTSEVRADLISLSGTASIGLAAGSRTSFRSAYNEHSYVSLAQPFHKASARLAVTPFSMLGVVGGISFARHGWDVDGGHYKTRSSTIIHESSILSGELGLEQSIGSWILQETYEIGAAVQNDYLLISNIELDSFSGRTDRLVSTHIRHGINLRLMKSIAHFGLFGVEGSYSRGRVKFNESYDHDEYGTATAAVIFGLRI